MICGSLKQHVNSFQPKFPLDEYLDEKTRSHLVSTWRIQVCWRIGEIFQMMLNGNISEEDGRRMFTDIAKFINMNEM